MPTVLISVTAGVENMRRHSGRSAAVLESIMLGVERCEQVNA